MLFGELNPTGIRPKTNFIKGYGFTGKQLMVQNGICCHDINVVYSADIVL